MRWRGRHIRIRAALAAAAALGLALGGGALWYAVDRALDAPFDAASYLEASVSPELLDRQGRLLYVYLDDGDHWRFHRPLDALSPFLRDAAVAVEDKRFHTHRGVDPAAVLRATIQNLRARRVVSGASTITMQLVKLGEAEPRTLRAKIRQAWTAMRLERHATKAEILEAYLNRVPQGLNLLGAEAASRRYFGKPAAELTLPEAALLAGMPKAPGRTQPLAHPEAATARRDFVLRRMREEGRIEAAEWDAARRAPLGAAWHDFPRLAPHLAMRHEARARDAGRLRTELDAAVQAMVERRLRRALPRFNGEITNAAAIVLEVETGAALAWAGSADFHGTPGGGQVDLCIAPRSPGSTLKPFAYAFALEDQTLYPSERLLDDTLDLGHYNPGNFDGAYHGLMSAADALRLSFNVPAVTVTGRIGVPRLHQGLRTLGLSTLDAAPDHYGLGLVLGNCEARLDELTAAYAAIARLGEHVPPRILAGAAEAEAVRRFSPGVARSIFAMLEQPFPGEPDHGRVRARGHRTPVAWKTGTSAGRRDAWTFAFNRHYVVGVWLGNNSGRGTPQLVGAHAALPLAAAIFRALPEKSGPAWPAPAEHLRNVEICAVSGLPASSWCRRRTQAAFAASQFLHRRCAMHRPGPEGAVLELWPGRAHGWDLAHESAMGAQGAGAAAGGAVEMARRELRILEPVDNGAYVLTGERRGDRIRLGSTRDRHETVHWYLNGRYLGAGQPGQPLLLDLEPGRHTIACMTAGGQTDTSQFEVAHPGAPRPLRVN